MTEQDKAMLEQAEEIDRLKRQLTDLREKSTAGPAEQPPPDERPPHY